MSELRAVSAHELTRTVLCRHPGCEDDALPHTVGLRGRYANLCRYHYDDVRRRSSEEQLASEARRRASGTDTASLEAQVRALVPLARRVDRAVRKLHRARAALADRRGELERAHAAWRQALRQLDETVERTLKAGGAEEAA